MTERTITEIEVALAGYFDWTRNLIVFNVTGLSILMNHECDMLILSKTGYLTEIEIKRTWSDFLNDFKKKHHHESDIIKSFFYCIPLSIEEKVKEYIASNKIQCNGIITYNEDLMLKTSNIFTPNFRKYRKLFLEEKFELARLGAMRVIPMKQKYSNLK